MTYEPAAPRSRRDRPAKPALTREGIVAAAVAVMRAEGLERVTMRRLAQELDTGAASIYVYVSNTAELHAAVLDRLMEGLLDSARPGGEWRERLVAILTAYTELLFEYPSLARSALVARPTGPGYLDLLETLLSLLHDGGVADDRAAWGVDLLLQTATATAAEQATRGHAFESAGEQDAFERIVRGAPADTYPHVAAMADNLLRGPGRTRLTWAFHVLIDGIAHTPTTGP